MTGLLIFSVAEKCYIKSRQRNDDDDDDDADDDFEYMHCALGVESIQYSLFNKKFNICKSIRLCDSHKIVKKEHKRNEIFSEMHRIY